MTTKPKKLSTNAKKIQAWEQQKIDNPRYFIAQLYVGPHEKFYFAWPPEGSRPATEADRRLVQTVGELMEMTHSHFGRQFAMYVMSRDGTALPIPRLPAMQNGEP